MRFGRLAALKSAAIIGAVTVALLGGSGIANATTGADGFPILYTDDGQVAHKCNILGTDQYGNQAILCVDIETIGASGVGVVYDDAIPRIEAYCQSSSGAEVQCANVTVEGELSNGAGGSEFYVGNCGHTHGACSTARNIYSGPMVDHGDDVQCGHNPDSVDQIWSIALGYITQIELPRSDDTVTLDTSNANDDFNESTGHYYYCWDWSN